MAISRLRTRYVNLVRSAICQIFFERFGIGTQNTGRTCWTQPDADGESFRARAAGNANSRQPRNHSNQNVVRRDSRFVHWRPGMRIPDSHATIRIKMWLEETPVLLPVGPGRRVHWLGGFDQRYPGKVQAI